MKRITRNLFLILLIFFIPPAIAFGQEKKNEKKIMVIIDDGSGAKTVLDTVLTGTPLPETIELKDGGIIFIGEPEMDLKHIADGKKVIVTVDTDENGEKQVEKKVIVMSSDSAKWTVSSAGDKEHVYVYSHSAAKPGKYIIIASSEDKIPGWEDVIISHGKVIKKESTGSFSVVIEDDEDLESDATKYIIAKDGVVVSVQCDDKEKANEILKLIESKLGVKSEEGDIKDKKTEKK